MTRATDSSASPFSIRVQKQQWAVLLFGLLLLLLAHGMALLFRIQPAVSLWFPPSGVAIALTLWLGPIGVLLTWVASFIVAPIWGNDGWARFASITDALEPLVAWMLFFYCFRGSLSLKSFRNAIAFLVSAPLLACGTSAVLGSLTLVAFGKMSLTSVPGVISHWWLGNAIGTMVIAPVVLLLASRFIRWHRQVDPEAAALQNPAGWQELQSRWPEITLLMGSVVAFAFLAVQATQLGSFVTLQLALLSIIPIFWAIARFGVTGSVLTASFSVLMTLLAYMWVYPQAMTLSIFPVDGELLYTHKLSLLLQSAIALLAGTAITERSATQLALEIEKLKRAETETRAQLGEKLLHVNHLLNESNQQLQASEERFRASVENILDCFGVYSAIRDDQGKIIDFRIDYVNGAACQNNQLTYEQQIGKRLCELLPGHRENGLFDDYCQVVETGEPLIRDSLVYEDEYEQRRLVKVFDIRIAKLGDGFVATWRDVTHRRLTEEQLYRHRQELQALIENSPDIIARVDRNLRHLYVSPVIEEITGMPPATFIGKSNRELGFPEELCQQWDTALENTFNSRKGGIYEFSFPAINGRWLHYESRLIPEFGDDGSVQSVLGITRDVTELKQVERSLRQVNEQFHLASEAVNSVIYDWDVRHNQITRTGGMDRVFGYTPKEIEATSEWYLALIHPEDFATVMAQVQTAFAQGDRYNVEYRVRNRQGDYLHVSDQGLMIRDEAGQVIRVVGSVADMSERARLEADRKSIEAALQESEKRYRSLAEAMPQIVWMADASGIATYCNQRWYDYTGLTPEEALNSGNIDRVHPEDRDRLQTQWAKALAESSILEIEIRLRSRDDTYRWFLCRSVPTYDPIGQLTGWIGTSTDIDDQKRTQEELRQSEEQLALALRAAQAGTWQWFKADNRTIWSDENLRLLGYEPGRVPSTYETWLQAVHPDDRAMAEKAVNQALEQQTALYFEYRVCLPDGSQRWLADIGQITYDAEGNPDGMTGIQIDITPRKEVEIALQQNQERLNLAMEAAGMGSWEWDIQTGEVYWSANLERLFGMAPGSFDGRYETVMAMIHPDDRPFVQQAIHRAVYEGQEYNIEFRFMDQHGHTRWAVGRGQVFYNAAGTPIRMAGIDLDISERKHAEASVQKSEERLRMALNATNQGLYDLNVQTGQTIVSAEYARMLGYDPEEFEETNQAWRDRLHPDDVAAVYRVYEEYVAGLRDEYRVEFRQRTKTGDWLWILSIGRIVEWDAEGKPLRMLGTHTDIHDRKEIEAERARLLAREQAARQQAESASRMKDEFLAIVSHELRSPLNGILGWSRLLRSRQLDPGTTEKALASIERNAQAQTQLIEDLLDISRIIRGTVRLTLRPVGLIPIVQASLDTIRPTAEAKSIHLVSHLDPNAGLVSGDSDRLQQIIWNLLSNAVKFTPNGGQVDIRLYRVDHHVRIAVTDTGKGISPEFLPHVFDRFRQADATTTRHQGGLGLGLAIVRSLVELHGGTIWVESPGEGLGATFTLELPLLSDGQASNGSFIPAASGHPTSLEHVRVLVVDDETDTREFLAIALEQFGAAVTTAASAAEAFARFQQDPPDILLSDIGMPEEDGYSLIQRIRALPPELGGQVPAAALTAYVRGDDRLEALQAGFQLHVPKPIEPLRLLQVVSQLRLQLGQ